MRYPPHLLDEIRARLPVSQVVARKVALKRAGREFKGLSPFKTEKTPSFTVNDQKGFYHCFATGEHGDVFTFLMKTEGVSFLEAVEHLADEAGVALPKEPVADPARVDERDRLLKLMQSADEYFQAQLFTNAARDARDYLAGRQLDNETLAIFGLGYAPNNRSALKQHLAQQGYSEADMITSGMLIGGPDIREPYDRFRNRIMFPIHDSKGRVVAFGGRALSADQPAKYLNSPETPLFHKGRLLYNLHRARQPAFDTGEIVAVEGYMDAIALAGAGFLQSVAPLGTALTPEQMQLMWRAAPEPILCFDGDAAGFKAAHRAIDTALPILKPGYSLRFAFLAEGMDPDDLVRQRGPDAVRAVLNEAKPLAEVLWQREWDAGDWSTPERRAGFEAKLRQLVSQISDPAVKTHYGHALRERLQNAWQSASQARQPYGDKKRSFEPHNKPNQKHSQNGNRLKTNAMSAPGRTSSLKASKLVAGAEQAIPYRETLLIRTLLNHPWLIEEHAETIAEITLKSLAMERIRGGLLELISRELDLDTDPIRAQLGRLRLSQDVELVDRLVTHRSDGFAEPGADSAEVEKGWRHTLAMHDRQALMDQLAATEQEFRSTGDDDIMARIVEIQHQIATSWATEAQFDD